MPITKVCSFPFFNPPVPTAAFPAPILLKSRRLAPASHGCRDRCASSGWTLLPIRAIAPFVSTFPFITRLPRKLARLSSTPCRDSDDRTSGTCRLCHGNQSYPVPRSSSQASPATQLFTDTPGECPHFILVTVENGSTILHADQESPIPSMLPIRLSNWLDNLRDSRRLIHRDRSSSPERNPVSLLRSLSTLGEYVLRLSLCPLITRDRLADGTTVLIRLTTPPSDTHPTVLVIPAINVPPNTRY